MKKIGLFSICLTIYCLFSVNLRAQITPKEDSTDFFVLQKHMYEYFTANGKKGTGYKQWKRAEYYLQNRLGSGGKIVPAALLNQSAKNTFIQQELQSKTKAGANFIETVSPDWSFVGPDSVAGTTDHGKGRVNRFAFDPFNPAIVYAATSGGGLWKTYNYGVSWIPLTDGIGNLSIGGVAVDPTNSNVIYILTGDGDAMSAWNNILIGTGRFCSGIFKSVDGGASWKKLNSFIINENQRILSYNLRINPKDPNRIYACTSDGLYMSFDGGNTWPAAKHLFGGYQMFNVQFAPNSKDTVYLSAVSRIYKSYNGGVSFNHTSLSIAGNNAAVQIAVTPINSAYVFAITYSQANSDKFYKIYRSTDYGESFSVINDADSTTDFQIWCHLSIAVNPLSPSYFAFSGKNIYYTSNGGSTYQVSPNSVDNSYHVDVHEVAYGVDGKLYAATDGGVFMSTNNGTSFTYRSGGLCVTQYYGLDILKSNANTIIAGAQDNSTHLKTTSGSTFDWKIGGDGLDAVINQSNANIIYGSSQNGEFQKSINGGSTFANFKSPVAILDTSNWRVPIKLDPNNQNIVYIGYQPISKYNGATWTRLQAGVSGRTDIEIAKDNSSVIYAADNTYNYAYDGSVPASKIFRSINGGTSFLTITPALVVSSQLQVTDITLNPTNNAEAWTSIGGFNGLYKVFRTINGGTNWQNATFNLPNVPVNCILYQPDFGGITGAVYVGTDIGVFFKNDNMTNWVYYSNNLPTAEIMDLELSDNNFLYAATYGRGIWKIIANNNICSNSYALTAANTNSQFSWRYSASNFVTSTAVHNGPDRIVIYKANNYISLNPGFIADAVNNTKFSAIIGPCEVSDPLKQDKNVANSISTPTQKTKNEKIKNKKKKVKKVQEEDDDD